MRFVMVPVPNEHVREVIGMVLAKSTDSGKNAVHDHGRLVRLVEGSTVVAQGVLREVATASVAGDEATLRAVAEAVGVDDDVVLAAVSDLEIRAMSRTAVLVTLSPSQSSLSMDPARASLVLDALHALDAAVR